MDFLTHKTVVDYKQVEIRIISKDILWDVFGLADPIVTIPTKRVRFVQYNNICSQSPNTQKTPDLQLFTLPFDFHIESQWRITQNTTIELVPEASQNKHRIYTKHIRRHLGPTGLRALVLSQHWRYMLFCFYSKNSAPMNFSVVSHKFLCSSHKLCSCIHSHCNTSSETAAIDPLPPQTKNDEEPTKGQTPLARTTISYHLSWFKWQPSPLRRGTNNILPESITQQLLHSPIFKCSAGPSVAEFRGSKQEVTNVHIAFK